MIRNSLMYVLHLVSYGLIFAGSMALFRLVDGVGIRDVNVTGCVLGYSLGALARYWYCLLDTKGKRSV